MAAYIAGCTNDGWDMMQLHSSPMFLIGKSTAKQNEFDCDCDQKETFIFIVDAWFTV